MPFAHIPDISQWLAATDIAELELRGPDGYLHLRQVGGVVKQLPEARPVTVTAAGVGIFLHRHPLHDAPLARRGTRVQSGQPVGLLRIGVLLLPVPAPVASIVGDMLAPHGAMVGFGSDLVILHPLAEQAHP